MKRLSVNSIFNEILLLRDKDKKNLYERMKNELFTDSGEEIVAYTADWKPLTREQYIQHVNEIIAEMERGEVVDHEDVIKMFNSGKLFREEV